MMNRNGMLQQIETVATWDIVIIGGGATGLGTAVDAATRGYKTLLAEQFDFAKGTSSRSTKLVHGGVRYLAQGNIKLVREALRERGLLLKNAPHVTNTMSFVLPCYSFWQKIYYGIGLMLYDILAGKLGLGKTKITSAKKTKELLPGVDATKLSGAIVYKDGQFDDARLAINLAQTAAENGAAVINYFKVIAVLKKDGKIYGIVAKDALSGRQYEIKCKVVINATGVFTDEVLKLDNTSAKDIVSPSQGIHLVLDEKFFPGLNALMIPKTADGRVLFAVPWHNKIVVGTTDTPVQNHSPEPKALEEEIDFVIQHFNKYATVNIERSDVRSVFAGLRPLVKKGAGNKTAIMPRDHTIIVSASGLVTITGGKWTTYRKMANDVLNNAVFTAKLEKKECVTGTLKIHGWSKNIDKANTLHFYGSDAAAIEKLCIENPGLKQRIHPALPFIKAEVIWAVHNEMAQTVEDVLARRIRLLFLDARAATESALTVAQLMAAVMLHDENWVQQQVTEFTALAKQYLLS